jgi:hypothetical protein
VTDKFKPYGDKDQFILGTAVTAVSTGHFVKVPEETFEQWLRRNLREYSVTLDLPPEVLSWTAQIVTYWSVAEWIQLGTLARLLKMERKEARVMFGSRIGNCAGKIKELLLSKDIPVQMDMSALAATLTECEKRRNLLGHGVWLIDPMTLELCVENPAGEWTPPKEPTISKRKFPQAFHPTLPWFIETLADVKTAIRELQSLDRQIDAALVVSPGKAG